MLRQVVIDDQHVAALKHEGFGDAGRRIRRDVEQARGLVAFGDNDDGVFERLIVAQIGDDLGDRRRPLANGAVDADDVLAALIEHRVDGDGGLAGAPVAEDQFALATSDRNHGVDDFQAGLQAARLPARGP